MDRALPAPSGQRRLTGPNGRRRGLMFGHCCALGALVLVIAGHATANVSIGLDTEISTSAIVNQDGSDTDYQQQLGHGSTLGLGYGSGPHRLAAGYSYDYRRTVINGDGQGLTWNGNTGYVYQPSRRYDLNLGHSIRAVAPQEDFLLDLTGYETRTTLSAGGGVNFFPTDRISTRLDAQGSRVLDDDLLVEGSQLRLSASGNTILTPQQTLGVTLSRSLQWDADNDWVSTLDSLQLNHQLALSNGALGSNIGLSLFETDTVSRLVFTGGLNRQWRGGPATTTLAYQRQVVDTITDFAVDVLVPPEEENAEPESVADLETDTIIITQQEGVIRDSLSLSRESGALCERCNVQWDGALTRNERVSSETVDWQYAAGSGLSYRINPVQQAGVNYRWQAGSDNFGRELGSIQQRVSVTWQRRLSERARANASAEHSWRYEDDLSRSVLQVGLRYGLINR